MEGEKYCDLGHAHLLPFIFCQSGLLSALSCDGRRNSDRRHEGKKWRAKNIATDGVLVFCPLHFQNRFTGRPLFFLFAQTCSLGDSIERSAVSGIVDRLGYRFWPRELYGIGDFLDGENDR